MQNIYFLGFFAYFLLFFNLEYIWRKYLTLETINYYNNIK